MIPDELKDSYSNTLEKINNDFLIPLHDEAYERGKLDGRKEAEAEIERLREIVDKLPKCWRLDSQGKLVQDVPVVHGMVLWTVIHGELHESSGELRYQKWGTYVNLGKDARYQKWGDHPDDRWVTVAAFLVGYGIGVLVEKCYSTREAAEAAARKG